MSIVVVRHAEPDIAPEVPPGGWPLSETGRQAARQLRSRLPQAGVWISSTESKAYETLLCASDGSIPIAQDDRFDEVHRNEPFDADFAARRRAWVQGHLDERHAGWEQPEEAAARFDLAVSNHRIESDPLVVASHGMVITAWLVHSRRWLSPQDAGEFWADMAFPDFIEVD